MTRKRTKQEAGRMGGRARIAKHGNPGTLEGRRLGGQRSIKTHQKNKTGFVVLRNIRLPKKSKELAELLGIAIGDGGLSNYQLTITTNSITDKQHAQHSKKLVNLLFGIPVALRKRPGQNAVVVVVSSKMLVGFLNKLGMPIGDKIRNKVGVPSWIYEKQEYKKAFIRGLFDTDGCIYLDKHKIKGKIYCNMGWTITSYSDKLCIGIIALLKYLGFFPTKRSSQKSVYLRRRKDIVRYFAEIGTSNRKHAVRYNKFK